MISRREALVGMGAVMLGAVAPPTSTLAELLESDAQGTQPAVEGHAAAAVEERLRHELAQMATRADSEEGVPVLLACVNLVADRSSHRVPPVRVAARNKAIAGEFRRNAAAWERIQPNATDGDVGKVIQVLAARDFANSGKERPS